MLAPRQQQQQPRKAFTALRPGRAGKERVCKLAVCARHAVPAAATPAGTTQSAWIRAACGRRPRRYRSNPWTSSASSTGGFACSAAAAAGPSARCFKPTVSSPSHAVLDVRYGPRTLGSVCVAAAARRRRGAQSALCPVVERPSLQPLLAGPKHCLLPFKLHLSSFPLLAATTPRWLTRKRCG